MRHFILASLLSLSASAAFGVELVNDATIADQIKQTEIFTLSNGIPVTYRHIEGSQIIHTQVSFGYGLVDLQGLEKAIPSVMFPLLTQGAKNWPKERSTVRSNKTLRPSAAMTASNTATAL